LVGEPNEQALSELTDDPTGQGTGWLVIAGQQAGACMQMLQLDRAESPKPRPVTGKELARQH
jgi:hypothetical protein